MSLLIRTLLLSIALLAPALSPETTFAADMAATKAASPPATPQAGQAPTISAEKSPVPASPGGATGQGAVGTIGGANGTSAPEAANPSVANQPPSSNASTELVTSSDFQLTSPISSRCANAQAATGFGYNNLNAGEPVIEGPINDQYLVSPGDEIVVSVWGRIVETMNLTVTAEGYIELPDQGGRIITNGVTLQELKPKIVQALAQIRAAYINAADPAKSQAFVDVQLGKLRKLSIYVIGEVNQPGVYAVSPGVANVVNLLHNACGVRPNGSLREIVIRHGSGATDRVDLYEYFLKSTFDHNKLHLAPGDSIMVPLKQKSATIQGEVRRPNLYELVGNEGLRELIEFAGGFGPDAYLKQSQIRRFEKNRGEVIMDVDLGEVTSQADGNLPLLDGDIVTVTKNIQVRTNNVTVTGGGITRAGTYEWKPGMRLADLIAKAEGLREDAYLDRADLIRTEADFSKKLTVLSLADLYQPGEDGQFAFTDNPDKNIPLHEMDELIIQSAFGMRGKEPHVTMEGHVKEPGRFPLAKGMNLYDLIFLRGGFQDAAFRKGTFMELAHLFRKVPGRIGTKIIDFSLQRLLDQDPSANLPLEEGDTIQIYAAADMRAEEYVRIDGMVKNPGKFHMAENLTVEDLILMAGGLMRDAFIYEAAISRTERNDQRDKSPADFDLVRTTITVPISGQDFTKTPREQRTRLQPFDHVMMRPMSGWKRSPVAKITGEVASPGVYTLEAANTTLSALIQRAGGLTPKALAEGIILERRGKIIDMEPDKEDFVKKDTRMADDPNASKEPTKTEEKAPPPPPVRGYERVIVNAAAALSDPGGPEDLILQNADKVYVPANPGIVEVRGAVKQPLILQHIAGRTLDDYIALCGGYLNSADPANVAIFAANKMAITKQLQAGSGKPKGKGKAQPTGNSAGIPPGSLIEVPFQRESERMLTVEVKGAVAKPALIQHIDGAPLGYYLNLSGGFTEDADLDQISVLLPNGGLLAKNGNQDFNPVIPGGSLVMISSRPQANPK